MNKSINKCKKIGTNVIYRKIIKIFKPVYKKMLLCYTVINEKT